MKTSIRYILLCALRDRLFLGLILGIFIAAMIASLLGGTAFLEEREMALSYTGGASRLMLAVGLIVFVCFHVRNAFISREIDVMLSRPISRTQLVVAYWLGFALIGTLLTVPVALALVMLKPLHWPGFIVFNASLVLETWFVVAVALFASLALKSAVSSVMACLGMYVVSRMMAFFVMSTQGAGLNSDIYILCKYVLQFLSMFMPRLDFFAKTEWLVYGLSGAHPWYLFVWQAAIFIPLLIAASVIDFRRKQF